MRVTFVLLIFFFLTAVVQAEDEFFPNHSREYPEVQIEEQWDRYPERIYFEFDSVHLKNLDKEYPKMDYAHLSDDAKRILLKLTKWLHENPDADILLEGHTDEYGLEDNNVILGEVYTRLVKNFLVEHGISDNRISTLSWGEERPLDFGMDEHSQMMNNRVEFKIKRK